MLLSLNKQINGCRGKVISFQHRFLVTLPLTINRMCEKKELGYAEQAEEFDRELAYEMKQQNREYDNHDHRGGPDDGCSFDCPLVK